MELINVFQDWMTSAMLLLGALVFLLGLWILVLPASFLKMGKFMGKWVSTEEYFDVIDTPHYQEGLVYRNHRLVGILIVLGALYTLGMLIVRVDVRALSGLMPVVINLFWSEWLYSSAYLMLIGANVIALAVGIVILSRPSMLKEIERRLNTWIIPERKLRQLDKPHEISVAVFPGGRPRLFGLAVALGGLYIMLSMGILLM